MTRRNKNGQAATNDRAASAARLAAELSKFTGQQFSATSSDGSPFAGDRAVSIRIVAPGSVYNDRVANPDPVLRQHSWDAICLYDRMERQFPTYAGVCNLWADKVCANDLAIKPGDPESGRSREMADLTRTMYRKLQGKHIVNRKAVKGRFFGFTLIGKAGWKRDDETKLNTPTDLYDIPHRYINFKTDGTACAITPFNFQGVPIPEDALMRFGWGSRFTPWGEADAQFCYLPLWYVQQVRQLKMQSVEVFGRPIPWVEVPDTIVGDEYDKLETGIKAQYKYYVLTRTSAARYTVNFPTMNILANGAAGKSEQEIERFHYGEVYIFVLGVQLTQDKVGGSRALEESRGGYVDDKTPPGLQALAQMWQSGYSDHIWRVNAPNESPSLYPIWTAAVTSPLVDGRQLQQIAAIVASFSANAITREACERQLAMAGVPDEWIFDITQSTTDWVAPGASSSLDGFRLQQATEVLMAYERNEIAETAAALLLESVGIPRKMVAGMIAATAENLSNLEPRLPKAGDVPPPPGDNPPPQEQQNAA